MRSCGFGFCPWWFSVASFGIDPWLARPNGGNGHWAAFLGELRVFAILPACIGFLRAGRPFSERLDDWFRHQSVGVSRASAAALRWPLAERRLAGWVESERVATQPSKPRREYRGEIWLNNCSQKT